ncbi:hypothetical protein GpartN1_g7807.t1 [Galdieria partita]|uniref:5-demethoxyubiquinone hydroxylase, mitochondrial n=1 Tax=Galdieria partita TaxID=83374 RepID=A0A9C7Q8K3_9RHOD|nr:hypothetical protein GpartN1_g7400.t1 [Galdieria partita]GJQ16002.1 hypothetical protein GpartN1_g7793.t1 [Galdieria partita]GJQ16016.1 hypothetical protein GpartN1_g7807.t1 [Galdieria partita]
MKQRVWLRRNGPSFTFCSKSDAKEWTIHEEKSFNSNNKEKEEDWKRYSPLFETDWDKRATIDSMLRVDHAGEVGAREIYAGQLAVLRGKRISEVIEEMAQQEEKHFQCFEKLLVERRIRPTLFLPLCRVAGFSLGALTALMGEKAAMACTVAVEEVISQHYNDQIRTIHERKWKEEEHLKQTLREFRDDEMEHHDTGIEYEAESFPFYRNLTRIIQWGCQTAIHITRRL